MELGGADGGRGIISGQGTQSSSKGLEPIRSCADIGMDSKAFESFLFSKEQRALTFAKLPARC